MSLRALALILDEGRKAADRMGDASLSAALSAMTEVAMAIEVPLYGWDVDRDFAELAKRYDPPAGH